MAGYARVLAVFAVALLCAGVAASAGFARSRISPRFIARTDSLCAGIDASFSHTIGTFPYSNFNPEKPDRPTLVLVGKYFAKALPIRGRIPVQLLELGEPAAGKAAWDAMRLLALEANAVGIEQVSAALAGNVTEFVATVHRLKRLHGTLVEKAGAAGFPTTSPCGDVF